VTAGGPVIRPALPRDVAAIRGLTAPYVARRLIVAKPPVAYYESVQEFEVASNAGGLVGCGALHVMWEDLAEIRTLAVRADQQGLGVGHALLGELLDRARRLGLRRVFCLTFETDFFAAHGFKPIAGLPVTQDVYEELLRSHDDGIAEFLDLARVKPNTLGNTRMLLHLDGPPASAGEAVMAGAPPASSAAPRGPERHVAISGDLGSGKSSVADLLGGELGFKVVSTGGLQREIAASLGLSTLEANLLAETDQSIDNRVDAVTRELAAEPAGIVFDSRMAWHFVPGALKVRLVVDPLAAAERILGRAPGQAESYESLEATFNGITRRAASEVRRFKARYGVDIARLRNFDLVLDTSGLSIAEAAAVIEAAYRSAARRPAGAAESILVNPRAIVPAFATAAAAGAEAIADHAFRPAVVYARPFFFAVGGELALRSALEEGAAVVSVELLAEGAEGTPWGVPAAEFPGPNAGAAGADGALPAEVLAWEREWGIDFAGLRRVAAARTGHPRLL
jgi:amino-acid N-acetyltransferase